mmetsp:Transcript_29863/g.56312  ORF Transcript_29863/g.56312 Transcript_29863/m.56312 type:complete len:1651 (-) Transcript_29863:482-5434(-)|eukprot:CAMPEP_0114289088 /NCGR_PEP_ID=MMETSP0059-20121206/7174_1 /TAXON_ID=36894 /ORGANISM="Pyramimonas parkeae, Strain CCMP726" /LENGTH=1650 /DNA_ID=CAMNT_0001410311 /DNA_START=356 /DNA_END=5308 /DNA_ORIENTATION=-
MGEHRASLPDGHSQWLKLPGPDVSPAVAPGADAAEEPREALSPLRAPQPRHFLPEGGPRARVCTTSSAVAHHFPDELGLRRRHRTSKTRAPRRLSYEEGKAARKGDRYPASGRASMGDRPRWDAATSGTASTGTSKVGALAGRPRRAGLKRNTSGKLSGSGSGSCAPPQRANLPRPTSPSVGSSASREIRQVFGAAQRGMLRSAQQACAYLAGSHEGSVVSSKQGLAASKYQRQRRTSSCSSDTHGTELSLADADSARLARVTEENRSAIQDLAQSTTAAAWDASVQGTGKERAHATACMQQKKEAAAAARVGVQDICNHFSAQAGGYQAMLQMQLGSSRDGEEDHASLRSKEGSGKGSKSAFRKERRAGSLPEVAEAVAEVDEAFDEVAGTDAEVDGGVAEVGKESDEVVEVPVAEVSRAVSDVDGRPARFTWESASHRATVGTDRHTQDELATTVAGSRAGSTATGSAIRVLPFPRHGTMDRTTITSLDNMADSDVEEDDLPQSPSLKKTWLDQVTREARHAVLARSPLGARPDGKDPGSGNKPGRESADTPNGVEEEEEEEEDNSSGRASFEARMDKDLGGRRHQSTIDNGQSFLELWLADMPSPGAGAESHAQGLAAKATEVVQAVRRSSLGLQVGDPDMPESRVSLSCYSDLAHAVTRARDPADRFKQTAWLEFINQSVEATYRVRLCEVEANTQASIISVAALTQTAFAIYLQTHLHDHPSQFVSMPEVGMAAMWCVAGFLAVAAAAMWVVYLSARRGWALQHWHQALSAATSGVAMLCLQAIPKLFPADYTLDDSMDASWTPRAGAGDSWRSASVETWVARCALLFLLNSNMGLTFKNAVRANALWAVLCLPEMAAWEWGWGAVKEARTLGITSLLLVQALTLVACYLRDKSLRLHMVKMMEMSMHNTCLQSTVVQMMPERFLLLHEQVNWHGEGTVIPELLIESYPHVTLMFCSFSKDDVVAIDEPEEFLELVGTLLSRFDLLVEGRRLFKVEHVCEDYVVASSHIKHGPDWTPADATNFAAEQAASMVELAQQMLDAAAACRTPSGHMLHFKVGLHSGPVMGGVAGLQRRFFRLFGDTMNTTARMAQSAPQGCIQVSAATRQLLSWDKKLDKTLVSRGTMAIKGKGMMETFLVQAGSGSGSNPKAQGSSVRASLESVDGGNLRFMLGLAPTSMRPENADTGALLSESVGGLDFLHGSYQDPQMEALFRVAHRTHFIEMAHFMVVAGAVVHVAFLAVLLMCQLDWHATWNPATVGVAVAGLLAFIGLQTFLTYKADNAQGGWPRPEDLPAVVQGTCAAFSAWGLLAAAATGSSVVGALLGVTVSVCTMRHGFHNKWRLGLAMLGPLAVAHALAAAAGAASLPAAVVHGMVLMCSLIADRDASMSARRMWELSHKFELKENQVLQVLLDLIPSLGARRFVMARQQQVVASCQTLDDSNLCVSWVNPYDDEAAVLSIDMVGFTKISEKLGPMAVMHLLHDVWCIMDSALAQFQAQPIAPEDDLDEMLKPASEDQESMPIPFKMDTVGDAYIVVLLLRRMSKQNELLVVSQLVQVAKAIAYGVNRYSMLGPHGLDPGQVQLRMGMSRGGVVAGVVGFEKPRYHIFGPVLQQAAMMESKSLPYHLRMDSSTAGLLCDETDIVNLLE